jgi:hypothetical protein
MKEMIFKALSLIQQTVTRELKAIQKTRYLWHSFHFMSNINIVLKQAETILSDGIINTFFYLFCVYFTSSVWEFNCHDV